LRREGAKLLGATSVVVNQDSVKPLAGSFSIEALGSSDEHPPIIEAETFAAVQEQLKDNRTHHRRRYSSSNALLIGPLFDDGSNRMTPSTAHKNGVRYRYYVSAMLAQGRDEEAGSRPRVSARIWKPPSCWNCAAVSPNWQNSTIETSSPDTLSAVLSSDGIKLEVINEANVTAVEIAWTPQPSNPRREIIGHKGPSEDAPRPIRADAREKLIRSIAQGRRWLEEIVKGVADPESIATRENCSRRQVDNMLSLAFLAPDLVQAIIDGRLPRGTTVSRLINSPLAWSAQWQVLGLTAPAR
jgi:hypothetical protein